MKSKSQKKMQKISQKGKKKPRRFRFDFTEGKMSKEISVILLVRDLMVTLEIVTCLAII